MHQCDRSDEPPSISTDQRISRRRQSQAFYTRFYCPSQTGQKPPRAQGRKITKVQFWNFPASAGKRIQSEAQGAVESLSPPWYRPGKVVLNSIVPAKSSWNMRFQLVPPWSRRVMTSSDEIEQVLQPWLRPGDVETIRGHSTSEVELDKAFQLVPPWATPGVSALDAGCLWLCVPP
jgi:hypothetical protein